MSTPSEPLYLLAKCQESLRTQSMLSSSLEVKVVVLLSIYNGVLIYIYILIVK